MKANTVQHCNLMSYRATKEYTKGISSDTEKPSVHSLNRRQRLQTFSEKRVTKSKVPQLEKDKRLVNTAMK